MLTVIHPFSPCFAGNPIVVKATTDKVLATDESLLRIVLEATFSDYNGNVPSVSTELSTPAMAGPEFTFNLSDPAQAVVGNFHSSWDMSNPSGDVITSSTGFWNMRIQGTYRLYEVWVKDGYEVRGDVTESFSIDAIPGALTDFEILSKDTIELTTLLKDGDYETRLLTRKPDLGILYKGERLLLPLCRINGGSMRVDLQLNGSQIESSRLLMYALHTEVFPLRTSEATADGVVEIDSDGVFRPRTGYLRTNADGVHLLRFINGFGTIENISVRSKDKLSYEVSGDTHSLVQKAGVRPTDRRYATKSQPAGVYELSSGYVPQQWAEWYVQELLTSPRVWIQIGGKWVPALIEAKDDCVIYDRTKPEMPHVDFTLRLAIDGVTGVTW